MPVDACKPQSNFKVPGYKKKRAKWCGVKNTASTATHNSCDIQLCKAVATVAKGATAAKLKRFSAAFKDVNSFLDVVCLPRSQREVRKVKLDHKRFGQCVRAFVTGKTTQNFGNERVDIKKLLKLLSGPVPKAEPRLKNNMGGLPGVNAIPLRLTYGKNVVVMQETVAVFKGMPCMRFIIKLPKSGKLMDVIVGNGRVLVERPVRKLLLAKKIPGLPRAPWENDKVIVETPQNRPRTKYRRPQSIRPYARGFIAPLQIPGILQKAFGRGAKWMRLDDQFYTYKGREAYLVLMVPPAGGRVFVWIDVKNGKILYKRYLTPVVSRSIRNP